MIDMQCSFSYDSLYIASIFFLFLFLLAVLTYFSFSYFQEEYAEMHATDVIYNFERLIFSQSSFTTCQTLTAVSLFLPLASMDIKM